MRSNRLPRTMIHKGIIESLSEFADKSRYYNLNYLTENNTSAQFNDPLKVWFQKVIVPILRLHYKKRQKEKHIKNAQIIDSLLKDKAAICFHSEDGKLLDNAFDASMQTALTDFAKPFCRMYTMQIMRFLAFLVSDLAYDAMQKGLNDIPYLSDFFAIFKNDDSYFKRRKTWSIYKL
jgi:hypothetical protein